MSDAASCITKAVTNETENVGNKCGEVQQVNRIQINSENPAGIKPENREKFVRLTTSGILNHYGPTFSNIKKDLERLNIRQEVLSVDISTEASKLREANAHVSLEEMISVTNYYKDKLISIKSSMSQVSDRTSKLRERALVLQERKQSEALGREAKRAQHLAREQQLIAKNDST